LVLWKWRIVFVVTPKAACTSVLWALAHVQGECAESFATAAGAEVTRRLTIHDLAKWHGATRLEHLADSELAELDARHGWFIFGIAREPLARVWSSWQSKLLLREPAFVARFGDAAWFPRPPTSGAQIVADFERFVDALRADPALAAADPHWAPQTLILRGDSFSHVGRVEQLEATYAKLEDHLRGMGWDGTLPRARDNRGILPLQPGWLRPSTIEAIADVYAADFARFGYASHPSTESNGDPTAAASPELPESVLEAARQIIARHERIGDLAELLRRAEDREVDDAGAERTPTAGLGDRLKRRRRVE
jgi:hypothetical protein